MPPAGRSEPRAERPGLLADAGGPWAWWTVLTTPADVRLRRSAISASSISPRDPVPTSRRDRPRRLPAGVLGHAALGEPEPPREPVRPGRWSGADWSACQAWSAGFDGPAVISPSAALPGYQAPGPLRSARTELGRRRPVRCHSRRPLRSRRGPCDRAGRPVDARPVAGHCARWVIRMGRRCAIRDAARRRSRPPRGMPRRTVVAGAPMPSPTGASVRVTMPLVVGGGRHESNRIESASWEAEDEALEPPREL